MAVVSVFLALPQALGRDRSPDREADTFHAALERLAVRCEQQGLPEAARHTRRWAIARSSDRRFFFLPDAAVKTLKTPAEHRASWDAWRAELLRLRRQHAVALYEQAGRVVRESPSTAYRLLHEVLFYDPQHRGARHALGRVRSNRSTPSIRLTRPRRVADITGWAPRQYAVATTPHFEITTNASRQATRRLAAELERLATVWQQMFFTYWSEGNWLADRLGGGNTPIPNFRRHRVVFVRSRTDYQRLLRDAGDAVQATLGYYSPKHRASLFYLAPDRQRTWYHEATHQLFQERSSTVATPGESRDAWAIEGVALYMESLRTFPGYCTVGGWDARRLQFARYRRLRGGFYMPLQALASLGRSDLQQHPELAKLYSQSAGLAHFFLDSSRDRLADAFQHYLQRIYAGRNEASLLSTTTQLPLPELDAQYLEFLKIDDRVIVDAPPAPDCRQLSLGMTRVTARGVRRLAHLTDLEWLDLAGLPVTSNDLGWLRQNKRLRQLMLERTTVDDTLDTTLAGARQLEELDLSHTRITNAILPAIAKLPKLTALWLSHTSIDDKGLDALRDARRLQTLDVEATRVSAEALRVLQRRLPRLKQTTGP